MPDDIKDAVVFMSEALRVLLGLCDDLVEDAETAEMLAEIRAAKEHYEGVLRTYHGILIPKGDPPVVSSGAPMDLVSLAEDMSRLPPTSTGP
jgi:hypothetical protein